PASRPKEGRSPHSTVRGYRSDPQAMHSCNFLESIDRFLVEKNQIQCPLFGWKVCLDQHVYKLCDRPSFCQHLLRDHAGGTHTGDGIDFEEIERLIPQNKIKTTDAVAIQDTEYFLAQIQALRHLIVGQTCRRNFFAGSLIFGLVVKELLSGPDFGNGKPDIFRPLFQYTGGIFHPLYKLFDQSLVINYPYFVQGFRNILPTVNLGHNRKSTRLNSSHVKISYAVFCLK